MPHLHQEWNCYIVTLSIISQIIWDCYIALELINMGVSKQDIVIGFHTPKMRQLSGFGVE